MAKNISDQEEQEKKLPYIHFYPGIWRDDLKVKCLSNQAKHIWLETLFIMNGTDQRGKLALNGRPLPIDVHADIVKYTVDETKAAIEEWFYHGVAYRDAEGIIYNKKMVNDTAKYEIHKANGKKGGNPGLNNSKKDKSDSKKETKNDSKGDNPPDNPGDNLPINPGDNPPDKPIVNVIGIGNVIGIDTLKKEKNIVDNKLSTHPDKPGIEFILKFNLLKGTADKPTSYKISPGIKNELSKRLKDYSLEQILTAASNCKEDKFHKENTKHLTPSFILRPEKLEKYLNCEKQVKETQGKYIHTPSRRIQEKLAALKEINQD